MPIYNEIEVLQVRIPKTASTSVNNVLAEANGGSNGIHASGLNKIHNNAYQLRQFLGEDKFDSYFKLSFTRNPFDWFVSHSMYFKEGQYTRWMGISLEEWIFGLERVLDSRDGDYSNYNPFYYAPSKSTVSCGHGRCQALAGRKECMCIRISQSGYLTIDDRIAMDFVGKLENIEEDWATVAEKIGKGLPLELPHHNKKEHSRGSYLPMFKDDRVVEIVYRLFKKDCDSYGYDISDYPGFKFL
jgi:hypothetical protein